MAWITLVTGVAATVAALLTVGAMLYFTLLSVRSDRHSPPNG